MQTYLRLQRLGNTKNRNIPYRKIVRVVIVPIVFAFAIALYLLMAFQKVEEVDQKEKTIKTEVAGEKTEKNMQEPFVTPTIKLTQALHASSPTPSSLNPSSRSQSEESSGSMKSITNGPSQLSPEPTRNQIIISTPTPEKLEIPSYLTKYTGENIMPINQGTIEFKVMADWQEGEYQILFWGNFNGEDRKNLIEIAGSDNWIAFDIHNNAGVEDGSSAPNGDMGDDYFGKTFNIVVTWDFTGDTKIKRIYINGDLKREIYAQSIPTVTNSQVLIGKITDLRISDKWEDR